MSAYVDYLLHDLLADVPGIKARAMFGGHGLYKDGIIFGIIADDQLYFKADAQTTPQYEKYGSGPFVYSQGNHKSTTMSYWLVPTEVESDPDLLTQWIDQAVLVSLRSKKKKSS